MLIGLCIALHSCNGDQETLAELPHKDYMAKLPEQSTLIYNGILFNACQNATRSPNGKQYEISAQKGEIKIVSYLFIDKINGGYLFEHYTEDRQLIASIQCNDNLKIEDIYIEPIPDTRGFRFWWGCTQQEYYKTKKYQEECDSMWMDLAADWLPMATINAVAAGLFCLGMY